MLHCACQISMRPLQLYHLLLRHRCLLSIISVGGFSFSLGCCCGCTCLSLKLFGFSYLLLCLHRCSYIDQTNSQHLLLRHGAFQATLSAAGKRHAATLTGTCSSLCSGAWPLMMFDFRGLQTSNSHFGFCWPQRLLHSLSTWTRTASQGGMHTPGHLA